MGGGDKNSVRFDATVPLSQPSRLRSVPPNSRLAEFQIARLLARSSPPRPPHNLLGHPALVAEQRELVARQGKFEKAALKWAKENADKTDYKSKEAARKRNREDDKKRAKLEQLMDANAHRQKVQIMDDTVVV